MDTPERAQIRSPVPKFEESPFSNFVNSLSPIRPAKAIHISQTFGSLSFTSPPSVFTSPQVSLQKETRFIRRYQLSELAKPEFSSGNEDKQQGGNAAADMPSKSTDAVEEAETSKNEGSQVELPREPKFNHGSPDFQTAPSFGYDAQSGAGTSSCIPLFKGESSKDSSGAQLGSFETGKNADGSSDWDILASDACDLLSFESPQNPSVQRDPTEQPVNEQTDLFASFFSDVNNPDQQHGLDPSSDMLFQNEDQVTQPEQSESLGQIRQGHDNDGTSCLSRSFSGQITGNLENKSVLHRGIRRRCLVFEIPGARKNVDGGIYSTSQSSQDEGNNSQQTTIMQRGNSPLHMRPGIGLHLNTLVAGSKGAENLSSEKQIVPVPRSSDVFPSVAIGSESFKSSASISSEDFSNVDNEGQVIDDGSQASAYGAGEDLNPSSPKKKRRRPENTGEGEACKRCNCKKSKCLKLYCECFAAGVYCIEPCACQDCFNKPIHEETVLATRKQIESRNPLAFAPKVIKGAGPVSDIGDDSNRTPASARHKRGCNCKKSNCLKKYCECYQGGVGCSIGCRCEGCKNTFGRKDGSSVGMELEVEEATPAHENEIGEGSLIQPGTQLDEEFNPGTTLPKTPLRLFRSTMALPSSSKGKPPRFMGISSCSMLNRDGPGRSTFLRTQHKTDNNKHLENATSVDDLPPVLHNTSPNTSIKTLSPNSKRISPPHHDTLRKSPGLRSSRKLILQSIPSFPSLTPRR